MRKGLNKLVTLGVNKGIPLFLVGTTVVFIKNKVTGSKDAVTLDKVGDEDGNRRIVVVGGSLSGLTTAYFLT